MVSGHMVRLVRLVRLVRVCRPWTFAALLLAAPAIAQDYPSRPIRMLVASSPGSGVDIVARLVAQRMSETLGVQIVVDNRAGAGGAIGVQIAAKSAPDGYTVLMAAPSFTVNATLMRPAPYDVIRDFAGVPGYVVTSWFGVVAPARAPRDAVAKLNAALNAVMRERDMQERIAAEGAESAPSRADEFGKFIASELATWARVIKAAGL